MSGTQKKQYKAVSRVKVGGKLHKPGDILSLDKIEEKEIDRLLEGNWIELHNNKRRSDTSAG